MDRLQFYSQPANKKLRNLLFELREVKDRRELSTKLA